MTCRPGDLVLIPFPYSDLNAAKKRPVLVLTAPDRHGDFIALAVTSAQETAACGAGCDSSGCPIRSPFGTAYAARPFCASITGTPYRANVSS